MNGAAVPPAARRGFLADRQQAQQQLKRDTGTRPALVLTPLQPACCQPWLLRAAARDWSSAGQQALQTLVDALAPSDFRETRLWAITTQSLASGMPSRSQWRTWCCS